MPLRVRVGAVGWPDRGSALNHGAGWSSRHSHGVTPPRLSWESAETFALPKGPPAPKGSACFVQLTPPPRRGYACWSPSLSSGMTLPAPG